MSIFKGLNVAKGSIDFSISPAIATCGAKRVSEIAKHIFKNFIFLILYMKDKTKDKKSQKFFIKELDLFSFENKKEILIIWEIKILKKYSYNISSKLFQT